MPRVPGGMFKRAGRGWYCRRWIDGKDRWVALGTDFETARNKFLDGKVVLPAVSKATVAELAEEWLTKRMALTRKPESLIKARSRVKLYLGPFMGNKRIGKVTREYLWGFRRWLEAHERKPSARSVHHILSDARCFFRWCEDSGVLDRCPFPRGIMPRIQEQPPDRLWPDEIEALLRIPEKYAFVIRFGLGTGMRWGEMMRAQASDVVNGVLVVHHTKSYKVRRIPLAPALRDELKTRVGKLVAFIEPGAFAVRVRKHSGVERFHAHMLRHSFACTWLEKGGSLAALQQLLGHSSIVTTQRYARISDDMVRAEVERVESVASSVATADSARSKAAS